MVETRRSDEPLVETVEPEALARRGRAAGHQPAGGAAVPERGRKAAPARSPTRVSEPRNPSYFEELLGANEASFWGLMAVRRATP